jgi:hypothetical protein
MTLTRGAGTMFRLRAGCTFARTCWRSHGEIIQDEAEPVHGARAKLGILALPTAALSRITPRHLPRARATGTSGNQVLDWCRARPRFLGPMASAPPTLRGIKSLHLVH